MKILAFLLNTYWFIKVCKYIVGNAIGKGKTQTVMIDSMVKVKVVRRFDGDLM